MGVFNELLLSGNLVQRVQFKHARCWQYEYKIGDKISWDGIERPIEADGTVLIPGVAIDGAVQGGVVYYQITIEGDVITSAIAIPKSEFDELGRCRAATTKPSD